MFRDLKLLFKWFLAIALAFSAVNAAAQRRERVINGNDVQNGAYPWMAAILSSFQSDTTEAHFCGGTLIGPALVLTAAHCVTYSFGALYHPLDIQVMIGRTVLPFDRGERVDVQGILIHPGFNAGTLENDFALLRLAYALPGPYITLATQSDSTLFAAGTTATVLGWGSIDPVQSVLPTKLQEATVDIHSDDTCLDVLGRYFKPAAMMCAGVLSSSPTELDGVDACQGDSGGPLVVADGVGGLRQVGIVSWGYECASPQFYGVYSKVPAAGAFLDLNTVFPPVSDGIPKIVVSGDDSTQQAEVDSILTCIPPKYLGDPVSTVSIRWRRELADGSFSDSIAEGATYRTTEDDLDASLICEVLAENQGGRALDESASVYIVQRTLPEPAPFPILGAPEVTPLFLHCGESRCRALALVIHPSGSDVIESVSATVTATSPGRCSFTDNATKTFQCRRKRSFSRPARMIGNDIWSLSFKRPNRSPTHLTVLFQANDKAGNTPFSVSSLEKDLELKASRKWITNKKSVTAILS